VLDRLHEEGLVERRLHPTDRRVRTLWLTPLAWDVLDRVLALNAEIREEACAGLPPAARDMLMRALGHMKGNLILAEAAESAAAE
jgi:MarR family transcriptional regulator, transcriptional regulator for hemolysin